MNRRTALHKISIATSAALCSGSAKALAVPDSNRTGMGMVTYALGIHSRNKWDGRHVGKCHSLALLEESRRLGAGGIQVDFKTADIPYLDKLHSRTERYGMYIEAIVQPPGNKADIQRFDLDIQHAKRAGAKLARTVIIPGRRYERFKSIEEFREFEKLGEQKLRWAEPVLRRHHFNLAVENHKDQRSWERLALLQRICSEHIGICVDVGNNFPLMEDPLQVVREFAPLAMTVHLKDQAIWRAEDGFWMADVPLGDGFLDLPGMVMALINEKPDIRFNYESITRDPILVPYMRDDFWVTIQDTPAASLASALSRLEEQSGQAPYPVISELPVREQLAAELQGITKSISYCRSLLKI